MLITDHVTLFFCWYISAAGVGSWNCEFRELVFVGSNREFVSARRCGPSGLFWGLWAPDRRTLWTAPTGRHRHLLRRRVCGGRVLWVGLCAHEWWSPRNAFILYFNFCLITIFTRWGTSSGRNYGTSVGINIDLLLYRGRGYRSRVLTYRLFSAAICHILINNCFIFRRNATHCISPYAIIVCVCVCLCVCVCVCVCLCVYTAFVDLRKTAWDRDVAFC